MYYDNSAGVLMGKNNKNKIQSKHIDIKYLAIRERVKEMKVVTEHISTEPMIVDPLTKGMPPKSFKDHLVQMGLGSTMQFYCTYIHYFNGTLIQYDIFSYGFVHFRLLLLF